MLKKYVIIPSMVLAAGLGAWLWQSRESASGTSCKLQGTLQYTDARTYAHENSKLTYRGVDHESRHILWKVTPQDDLRVGPNIFDRLPLPDGETLIFVVLPEYPVAKEYTLTASINYGRNNEDGILHTYTAQCSGKTTIKLVP